MSLENQYKELLAEVKNGNLVEEAKKISSNKKNTDYTPEVWTKGLAILDACTETSPEFENLMRELFKKGRDRIISLHLNDEDYDFIFKKNIEVCTKFTEFGYNRAWETLALRYVLARKGYSNPALEMQYYKEGMAKGDLDSMASYAYAVLSKKNEEEKEEALKCLQKAKEAGLAKAFEMSFAIDLRSEEITGETLLKNIEDYIVTVKEEEDKPWDLVGEVYLIKLNNEEKAMENFMKDEECVITRYHMGFLILNEYTNTYPVEKGLEFLESIAYYTEAAYRLGLYNYRVKQNSEKAREWYNTALRQDDHAGSLFELSMMDIYDVKDKEKGLVLLNKAMELNYSPAFLEKSFLVEDAEEIRTLLEKSVELGNIYAPYHLGVAYQNGKFGEQDLRKAFECFQIGSERNAIQAIEMLGYYYMGNFEEVADEKKGIECYQKASDLGSNWATVELGRCYQDGIGVEKNYAKTVELYTKASENNYPYAFVMLGEFYAYMNPEGADYTKAFKYFSEAARADVADGYYNVGRMYKYAMGIDANPVLAVENFQKAMDKNSIDAKIEVALAYERGEGIEQDKDKAFDLMKEMADQNISYAQYKLGAYYYYAFVKEDEAKGLEWFNKSYENGSALGALALGEHYLYNSKEEDDSNQAFQYFQFAAERNQISEGIGICYLYGLGTDENEEEAFKNFKIASDRGYTAATYRLGLCYRDGLGTEKNEEEGHSYLLNAANNNNIYSIYAVGMNFMKGRGVEADPKTGAEYLLKAAEREYSYAQYELANCFLSGNGVPEDEEKAMYWYKKAADNGHKEAKDIVG